jgi:hypothetical protein
MSADHLEKDPIHLEFDFNGTEYKGKAVPITETCTDDGVCYEAE